MRKRQQREGVEVASLSLHNNDEVFANVRIMAGNRKHRPVRVCSNWCYVVCESTSLKILDKRKFLCLRHIFAYFLCIPGTRGTCLCVRIWYTMYVIHTYDIPVPDTCVSIIPAGTLPGIRTHLIFPVHTTETRVFGCSRSTASSRCGGRRAANVHPFPSMHICVCTYESGIYR